MKYTKAIQNFIIFIFTIGNFIAFYFLKKYNLSTDIRYFVIGIARDFFFIVISFYIYSIRKANSKNPNIGKIKFIDKTSESIGSASNRMNMTKFGLYIAISAIQIALLLEALDILKQNSGGSGLLMIGGFLIGFIIILYSNGFLVYDKGTKRIRLVKKD